jgi:hypothetical protein
LIDNDKIDDDGDGPANPIDVQPFEGVQILDVFLSDKNEPLVNFTWLAEANSTYQVEFAESLDEVKGTSVGNWNILTRVLNNTQQSANMSVEDPVNVSSGVRNRFYRVRQIEN